MALHTKTLYFYQYLNYANRQIKKFNTIGEYPTEQLKYIQQRYSFNPADGVNTEVILNTTEANDANYIVVIDEATGDIDSRWYIMESNRLRNGQYSMSIRRDLIADYYDYVMNCSAFIKKGRLENDDPMIFNTEGMNFNQIKKREDLLKDTTGCAWIVGYCANSLGETEKAVTYTGQYTVPVSGTYEALSDFPYASYLNGTWQSYKDSSWYIGVKYLYNNDGFISYSNGKGTSSYQPTSESISYLTTTLAPSDITNEWNDLCADKYDQYFSPYYLTNRHNMSATNNLLYWNGRVIYVSGDKKYYKIIIKVIENGEYTQAPIDSQYNNLRYAPSNLDLEGSPTKDNFINKFSGSTYSVDAVEVSGSYASMSITIPADFVHLDDAPYSMFCIPCPANGSSYTTIDDITLDYDISMNIANMLNKGMQPASTGSGFLYDLQLLPYCPIEEIRDGKTYGGTYYVDKTDGDHIGVVYFSRKSSFSLTIPYTIDITEPKISNECDVYRITSPNYASSYEFSPAMNGGVEYMHVICTYKPYNPYINVHPNYKGLYGSDFEDSSGLVCGGDFSLPMMSDQWQQYQINNKNYAATFDRQIQSLQRYRELHRTTEVLSTIADTVTGISNGVQAGIMSTGSPIGGIVGGVLGGAASAAGGITDYAISEGTHQEDISYRTDQYNYNLQNIQARPDGLIKTSGFNINNKLWPIVEYYTCTDIEKQTFRRKLTLNGMTIMRIDSPKNYVTEGVSRYLQADIIRSSGIPGDAHLFDELKSELSQGVFITGGK